MASSGLVQMSSKDGVPPVFKHEKWKQNSIDLLHFLHKRINLQIRFHITNMLVSETNLLFFLA